MHCEWCQHVCNTAHVVLTLVCVPTCLPDFLLLSCVYPSSPLSWANAVPTSWLTPSLVPASLADTLAAAACDEALDLLLPQLRRGARPLLQQLRPGALQVRGSCLCLHVGATLEQAWRQLSLP
jgi:hypothetical protein